MTMGASITPEPATPGQVHQIGQIVRASITDMFESEEALVAEIGLSKRGGQNAIEQGQQLKALIRDGVKAAIAAFEPNDPAEQVVVRKSEGALKDGEDLRIGRSPAGDV